MQCKMMLKLTFIACILSIAPIVVSGQNTDSRPIITANNIQQLAPISTLESSYLGDLVWSDDGRWLALGTSHDGVQVFQASDLNAPPIILPAGTDVLFHPNSDYLASAGSLWEIESQTALFSFGAVDYQQFSPDGELLFTARRDNEQVNFTLWHIATGNMLNSFTVDTAQEFKQIVFSEDASRYALVFRPYDRYANTGTPFIEVRNTADASLLLSIEPTYSEVTNLVFANDGQHLVFTNYDFATYGSPPIEIVFWDIANQMILQVIDTIGTDPLLSPDRNWLFVPKNFQSDAYLLELDTQQILYLNFGDRVETYLGLPIIYSPNASYLGIPYYEQMQDTSQQGVIVQSISPATEFLSAPIKLFLDSSQVEGSITSIDFSADETLVAVSYSGQTIIWDIASQSIRQIIDDGGQVRFAPEAPNLIMIDTTFWDTNLWDIETASIVGQATTVQIDNFSPNGIQVATRLRDSVYIANLITNEEMTLPILDDYLGQVALLDAENDFIIFHGERLFAHDLATESRLLQADAISSGLWTSDDGSILVTQTRSETSSTGIIVTAYDLDANTSIQLEDIFVQPETVAISPDKQVIFISLRDAANNTQLFLYDGQTGLSLNHWQSDMDFVIFATFSTDSQYLMSAGRVEGENGFEFALHIWDVADLVAGEIEQSLSTLELSQRDFIVSAELNFTINSQELIISLNDALLGDGRINGYRVEIFDWHDILAIEGSLNEYYIEHLTLEGATNASFATNNPVIVSDAIFWNMEVGQHDSFLLLWDSTTGEPIVELANFKDANLSPDGNLVIALSTNPTSSGEMMVWRVDDLLNGDTTPLTVIDSPDVTDIAFSADGQRIYQRTNYSVITLGIVP